VQSGLVRSIHFDGGRRVSAPTCAITAIFIGMIAGAIYDIDYQPEVPRNKIRIPVHFQVTHYELVHPRFVRRRVWRNAPGASRLDDRRGCARKPRPPRLASRFAPRPRSALKDKESE